MSCPRPQLRSICPGDLDGFGDPLVVLIESQRLRRSSLIRSTTELSMFGDRPDEARGRAARAALERSARHSNPRNLLYGNMQNLLDLPKSLADLAKKTDSGGRFVPARLPSILQQMAPAGTSRGSLLPRASGGSLLPTAFGGSVLPRVPAAPAVRHPVLRRGHLGERRVLLARRRPHRRNLTTAGVQSARQLGEATNSAF